MDSPLELVVYDAQFNRKQEVADPIYCSFTPRFNALGTGELSVGADDPINEFLLAPGARLRVDYQGEHLISGRLLERTGSVDPTGEVVYQLQGDWRIFKNTLAYVRPGGSVEAGSLTDLAQSWQRSAGAAGTIAGQTGYFQWPAEISSAEDAIRHLLERNLQGRLQRPVVIAPSLGRGGDARAAGLLRDSIRNQFLDEAIAPLLEFSGLGLRARQLDGDKFITIDMWEPREWPQVLDHESGVVVSGEWTTAPAEATRALIGGPGENTARAFLEHVDVELEAAENDVIEVFKDATGGTIEWPEGLADALQVPKYYQHRPEVDPADKAAFRRQLLAAAVDALAEAKATAGLSLELAETEAFHVGGREGIAIGDPVRISAGGQEFADRLIAATFTLSDGFSVTPQVGNAPDEDEALWRALDKLAAANRNLSTRR